MAYVLLLNSGMIAAVLECVLMRVFVCVVVLFEVVFVVLFN